MGMSAIRPKPDLLDSDYREALAAYVAYPRLRRPRSSRPGLADRLGGDFPRRDTVALRDDPSGLSRLADRLAAHQRGARAGDPAHRSRPARRFGAAAGVRAPAARGAGARDTRGRTQDPGVPAG